MQTQTETMTFNQAEGLRSFFGKIYGKMATGVLVTAIVAFALVYTSFGIQFLQTIFSNNAFYYGIVGIQLTLLFGIQWGINRLSKQWAEFLFYIYSAVTGITLSVILISYTGSTLISTFIAAVAIFVALAAVGKNMKYDMSGWKVFLFTGMWGVFIASIANIFLASSRLDWIVTIVAVIVFAGLTVYDAQQYKRLYLGSQEGQDLSKMITLGALHMYINFIMIFVNLLKIVGGRD
ncbi:MAG: Bax inhibitor-1/YccA family protein [Candidatus Pacebacteria bacterium]|nr:Bax inhibitor-1/YccA family protein [Candidatus Paceibacterota bacterium]